MRIALDYDGTYTRAPALWDAFIASVKQHGVEVVCVTMRHPEEVAEIGCPVHYTGREAKLFWCARNGLQIDVWIDDMPQYIVGDAR